MGNKSCKQTFEIKDIECCVVEAELSHPIDEFCNNLRYLYVYNVPDDFVSEYKKYYDDIAGPLKEMSNDKYDMRLQIRSDLTHVHGGKLPSSIKQKFKVERAVFILRRKGKGELNFVKDSLLNIYIA